MRWLETLALPTPTENIDHNIQKARNERKINESRMSQ